MILSILIIQLTSCRTLKNQNRKIPDFPPPVDIEGNVIVSFDESTHTVTMPFWYWIKITEYAVEVQGVE